MALDNVCGIFLFFLALPRLDIVLVGGLLSIANSYMLFGDGTIHGHTDTSNHSLIVPSEKPLPGRLQPDDVCGSVCVCASEREREMSCFDVLVCSNNT